MDVTFFVKLLRLFSALVWNLSYNWSYEEKMAVALGTDCDRIANCDRVGFQAAI